MPTPVNEAKRDLLRQPAPGGFPGGDDTVFDGMLGAWFGSFLKRPVPGPDGTVDVGETAAYSTALEKLTAYYARVETELGDIEEALGSAVEGDAPTPTPVSDVSSLQGCKVARWQGVCGQAWPGQPVHVQHGSAIGVCKLFVL